MVFQRRKDGSENFYRRWNAYKNGFGNLTGEFWLGNEKIHQLLQMNNQYELRVDLRDRYDTAYAKYDNFSIGPGNDGYRLTANGYSGSAGDSLTYHDGAKFSTRNRDNDIWRNQSCADLRKGGWWYRACCWTNLNGLYNPPWWDLETGITWMEWKGWTHNLKFTEMKFRERTVVYSLI